MALNIILVCLVAITALNTMLVYDLYNRSARLAKFADQVHRINMSMQHSLSSIQAKILEATKR